MGNISLRRLLGTAAGLALMLSAGAAQAEGTIALVTINQQALFFNQINDGAQSAADKNGVKLVIFNANNQPTAQNTAIENYVTQKVDGIVLVAIDVNGVKPAITAAKNAGIPVVAIDARIPDGAVINEVLGPLQDRVRHASERDGDGAQPIRVIDFVTVVA